MRTDNYHFDAKAQWYMQKFFHDEFQVFTNTEGEFDGRQYAGHPPRRPRWQLALEAGGTPGAASASASHAGAPGAPASTVPVTTPAGIPPKPTRPTPGSPEALIPRMSVGQQSSNPTITPTPSEAAAESPQPQGTVPAALQETVPQPTTPQELTQGGTSYDVTMGAYLTFC